MPFADVNGVHMFYTDDGPREQSVLLVHGWTCDSHDWSWQIPAFAQNLRVIAVDVRGHGRSSTPSGSVNLGTIATDLAELITSLDAGPVVAVGHSLGGVWISALAVEYPELVRAVVAVDPGYGWDLEAKPFVDQMFEAMSGPSAYETLGPSISAQEGPVTPPALATWHLRRALAMPLNFLAEIMAAKTPDGGSFIYKPESESYLQGRRCPVFSICLDPAKAAWDASINSHPYNRHIGWEGSGHWLNQERPAEFNSLVLAWIEGLS